MSITAIVEALVLAGASPETILAAVRAAESFQEDALAKRRASDAARQRALREKRNNVTSRVSRESRDVAVTHGDIPKTSMKSQASEPARVRDITPISENNHLAVAAVVEARANAPDDWPTGDAHDHLRRLVIEAGSPRLDPAKTPGLITTLGRLAAWRRDGASWEHEVVPVITTIARKRGPPINTWKFFDAAIAQSIADNRKALTIPEASDVPSPKRSQREANLARAFAATEAASRLRQSS